MSNPDIQRLTSPEQQEHAEHQQAISDTLGEVANLYAMIEDGEFTGITEGSSPEDIKSGKPLTYGDAELSFNPIKHSEFRSPVAERTQVVSYKTTQEDKSTWETLIYANGEAEVRSYDAATQEPSARSAKTRELQTTKEAVEALTTKLLVARPKR